MKLNHSQGDNFVTLDHDGEPLTASLLDEAIAIATKAQWAWALHISLSLEEFAASKELLTSRDFVISGTETRNVKRVTVTFMNVRRAIRRSPDGGQRKLPTLTT